MGAGDDNSTDIETKVKAFAKDMEAACATLRKASMDKAAKDNKDPKKKAADPPVVTFALSQNKDSGSRTPAEQAAQVADGKSWVCWGAHMADKARHVIMKANGSVTWDAKKTMGDDFDAFKKKWGEVMSKNGLKNYKGEDGWGPGDEFHLELPDSKISKTDERVGACLAEYAKLTRKDGKAKNDKFEKDYSSLLEKYVSQYDKK